jgi:hypothetical protein
MPAIHRICGQHCGQPCGSPAEGPTFLAASFVAPVLSSGFTLKINHLHRYDNIVTVGLPVLRIHRRTVEFSGGGAEAFLG